MNSVSKQKPLTVDDLQPISQINVTELLKKRRSAPILDAVVEQDRSKRRRTDEGNSGDARPLRPVKRSANHRKTLGGGAKRVLTQTARNVSGKENALPSRSTPAQCEPPVGLQNKVFSGPLSSSDSKPFLKRQRSDEKPTTASLPARLSDRHLRSSGTTSTQSTKPRAIAKPRSVLERPRSVLEKSQGASAEKYPLSSFVTKSEMYQNQSWMQQQQDVFTLLINDVFTSAKLDGQIVKLLTRSDVQNVRQRMFRLYGDECHAIKQRVEAAFRFKKLHLKGNLDLVKDIGAQKAFLEALFALESQPLALALEVVTGRQTSNLLNSNRVDLREFAKEFIVQHSDASGPRLSVMKATKLSVTKVIMMIIALDKAHTAGILTGRLFRRDACIKSTAGMLANLADGCLTGEGDMARQVQYMGHRVTYVQYLFDELDYRITNLAVDLRDGVRLTRLVEILAGPDGLSSQLRYPVVTPSQKLHNNMLALGAMRDAGVDLRLSGGIVTAQSLVDGHREKTLGLLWRIVTKWCLPSLVNESLLRQELVKLESLTEQVDDEEEDDVDPPSFENSTIGLLFAWAKAACTMRGFGIQNFTTSFSKASGQAFTIILEHYIADLIREEGTDDKPLDCEDMLEAVGCRELFNTLGLTGNAQGRIMDQDAVIACLAILHSRVFTLLKKDHAARKIQETWRRYLARKAGADPEGIAKYVLFVQETQAAIRIQRCFRTHLEKRIQALLLHTIQLQALSRGFLVRRRFRQELETLEPEESFWL